MGRTVRVAVLMLVLLGGSAFAGATTALAKNSNVLVYARATHGGFQEVREGTIASASLRSIGYTVTQTEYLPENLSTFTSIWSVRGFEAMSAHEQERLAEYVSGGGHLLLTGDGPWSDNVNESDQAIARSVLAEKDIVVGQQGFVSGEMTFNQNALDRVATKPNLLGGFLGTTAGGIAGIAHGNVLASNGAMPVAGVFDEGDMTSGDGRLVIYMNLDWLGRTPAPSSSAGIGGTDGSAARPNNVPGEPGESGWPARRLELVENLEDFLEKTPGRRRPPSAEYVALGDSYASGAGSFEYIKGSTSKHGGCFKAKHGYAENIASDFKLSLSFPACYGNTVSNLTEGANAQLKQLGPDTKYVTLTIGGNDVGFSSVLKSCIAGFKAEGGEKGCAERDAAAGEQALEWLRVGRPPGEHESPGGHGVLHNIEYLPSLQHLYEMVLEQAPQAHVVVILYPLLIESAREPAVDCRVGTALGLDRLTINAHDIEWIDQSDNAVDTLIEEAVQGAKVATGNRDIQFADPRPGFKGHSLCDPAEEPYINGVLVSAKLRKLLGSGSGLENPLEWWEHEFETETAIESFHPTVVGQLVFQQAIEETLVF